MNSLGTEPSFSPTTRARGPWAGCGMGTTDEDNQSRVVESVVTAGCCLLKVMLQVGGEEGAVVMGRWHEAPSSRKL